MLKIRVFTAAFIFLATLALLFLTPAWLFRLAVALVLMVGCWEYRRLADLPENAGIALLVLQAFIVSGLLLTWPATSRETLALLGGACVAWLLMFARLALYRPGRAPDARYRRLGFTSAVGGLSFALFALSWLRDQQEGPFLLLLLFLLIWAADVGAYFSGRFLGRHKLAPNISPNKTWEGAIGGMLLAMAAAFVLVRLIPGLTAPPAALVVLAVATTLASIGGDLYISIQKRTVGIKDTGSLFPGHGGVLDRYDSLLAGAPFFAMAWAWMAP